MICDRFMIGFSVFGIPAATVGILRAARKGWWLSIAILICVIAITLIATFFRKRIPYPVKALFVPLLIASIGVLGLSMYGLVSAGIPFLIAAPLLALLLLGWHRAIIVLSAIVVVTTAMALRILKTGMLPDIDLASYLTSPEAWASVLVTIIAVAGSLIYAFRGYANSLINAITERQAAAEKALQAQKVALIALADLAEYRDIDSGGHVQRVARLSHEIAQNLFSKKYEPETCNVEFLNYIGLASILHDVGKVTVPDSILFKHGKLTHEEWLVMQRHAGNGAGILSKAMRMLPGSMHFTLATQIARSHHEQWDGSGYPDGLKGNTIPLPARIVAVADVFDALISERTYKTAWPFDEALDYVRQRGNKQFDAVVVDAFLAVIARRDKVSAFVWDENMTIGHALLDRDHRILLNLLSQISSPDTFEDPISSKFMLDELTNYTHYHFSREEKLMEEWSYPEVEAHRAMHEEFRTRIAAIQSSYEKQESGIRDRVVSELAVWLKEHIMGTDRLLIPYR
jgi:hemerythrin-like metal-binding protein